MLKNPIMEAKNVEPLKASRSRGAWQPRASRELSKPFPPPGRYIGHFPVNSPAESQVLSRQKVWDVFDYVRRAGGLGVSADEISENLEIPRTDTYTILKELSRLGYLFVSPRDKRRRGERKRTYLCEKVAWKRYIIDEKIVQSLRNDEALRAQVENLKGFLFNGLLQVYDSLAKDHKDLLPLPSQDRFCPKCGVNHEALEFFYAIVLGFLSSSMDDTESFREFLSLLGYTR